MYFVSNLFITDTFLDLAKINTYIYQVLKEKIVNIEKWSSEIVADDVKNKEILDQYLSGINQNIIIIPNFENKDEFKSILSEIYQSYPVKTYLFLGDINAYSLQLQEGLLKLIEEPPENLQIILYSQNTNHILGTIKSRVKLNIIPNCLILKCINSDLIEIVKKKFPLPLDFVKEYCLDDQNESIKNSIDVSKAERAEIEMWLWQILFYLKTIYQQKNGSRLIATKIEKVLIAIDYSRRNTQKKFVIESLFF